MSPRIWMAAAALVVLLAFSEAPGQSFPWPSRWNSKPKAPDLGGPPANTTPTTTPGVPPPVTWPPRGREHLPDATLPKLPSPPVVKAAPPRPQPEPTRSVLANSVELGRPVPLTDPAPGVTVGTLPAVLPTPQVTTNPTPAAPPGPSPYGPPGVGPVPGTEVVQRVGFDSPRTVVRAQRDDPNILPVQLSGPPPVPPPGGTAPPSNPLPPLLPPGDYNAGVEMGQPLGRAPASGGASFTEFFGFGGSGPAGPPGECGFCVSDHAFDEGFISPITNPFLFEDPRALTEIKPVFVYGVIPNGSALQGGNMAWFGLQGRVNFGPSLSIVMNKLGGVGLYPDGALVDGSTGFSEINIGPKWTFWRDADKGMVAAAGLTFQIPIGSSSVFQNTGSLGLDPYFSYAWNFGRTSWGSFNYISTIGYNFRLDDARDEFFHTHSHLSYDVANMHRFYPLVEFNWYKYTRQGNATAFNFIGKDVFNVGASNGGFHSYVTVAPGFRFKYNESIQSGIAAEWTLNNTETSIDKFRLTFDVIFRW